MNVHDSAVRPDSKIVVGVSAEVISPFPTQWMQVGWVRVLCTFTVASVN